MMRIVGLSLRLFMLLFVALVTAALGTLTAQRIAEGEPFSMDELEAARYAESWVFDSTDAVQDGTFDKMAWQKERGFVPEAEALAKGEVGRYLSPALNPESPARAVVVDWSATAERADSVKLSLRWREKGRWGEWVEFSPEDHTHLRGGQFSQNDQYQGVSESFYLLPSRNSARVEFSTPLLVPHVTAMQLRVEVERGAVLHRVTLGTLDVPQGVGAMALESLAVRLPDGGPMVIPRDEWGQGLGSVRWGPEPNKPRGIIVHHTATSAGEDDPATVVRMIDVYHRKTRNWGDIGYHYLIDYQGRIYQGRNGGPGSVGAHAYNFNNGTVGIALLGTYETRTITPSARESLVSLIAWLSRRYEIDPGGTARYHDQSYPTIMSHRDTGRATSCPGDRLWSELPHLRKLVAEILAGNDALVPPGIELAPSGEWVTGTIKVLISHEEMMPVELALHLNKETLHVSEDPFQYPIDTTKLEDGQHLLVAIARQDEKSARSERLIQVDNSPPVIEVGDRATEERAAVSIEDEASRLQRIEWRRRDSEGFWSEWKLVDAPYPLSNFEHEISFEDGVALQWRAVDGVGHKTESPVVERVIARPTAGPTSTPVPEAALQIESLELFPAKLSTNTTVTLQVVVVNRGDRPTDEATIVEVRMDEEPLVSWRIHPDLPPGGVALLRSDRDTLPGATFAGRLPAGEHRLIAAIPGSDLSFDPLTVSVTRPAVPAWQELLDKILDKLRKLGGGS